MAIFYKRQVISGEPAAGRICFIGRLAEQKNLPTLFTAIQGLDVELVIAGGGHLRPKLENQAATLGLNVRFLGNVPHLELPGLVSGSALFVLPSLYEGHPKTLLEAMACGAPVIGTDVPGIREVIEDGKTGLLCEPTAEGLRESISALLADAALRKTLGAAARQQVVHENSLDRIVDQEDALLQELA